MFLWNIFYRIAVFRRNRRIPRRTKPIPHNVINIKFNPTGSNATLPSIITAVIVLSAKDVSITSKSTISGETSNPPRTWSGKMINHASPPAELVEFTKEAGNKTNPRELNATKKYESFHILRLEKLEEK